ncbi:hypothetical protein BDW02DRAFT_504081 [Decorospora gaudefroyi]|uniref:F-box domain-containing protein n=1 Tax=Decorospora gaudefroyi TaxID=184978 RepID=A0A6A5KC26_9PLEO|nr:hypothetical protein BDW02DRAFT_504081 [Decorospora gaudefroyi]
MTTIGFPFDNLRPQVARPKKSFLQRLNDTHDQLISHMRLLKVDELPVAVKPSAERSRAWSTTSLTDSERSYTQDVTKTIEIESESPPSTGTISPPLSPHDGSFPLHQFLAPRDRKTSREFVHGLQTYVQWKQDAYEASLGRESPISPPRTPQSSRSCASSRTARTDLSDEQMDDWLERPVDADLHRYQKRAAASWLDDGTDSDSEEKKIHVIEEQPDKEDDATMDIWQRASILYRQRSVQKSETEHDSDDASQSDGELSTPKEDAPPSVEDSKLLSLPDQVLNNIAFCMGPEDAKPFRLSCMRLYDLGG